MTNSVPRQTPLYDIHCELGAKIVEFAGFSMPVAYGSIIEEHRAVRERVGIFDVSHMGEFDIRGPAARELVDEMITNDLTRVAPGGLQYTVMCREDGGVVDDLLVFVVDEERVVVVVNAANIDKDLAHVNQFARPGAVIENVSDRFALIAVQGPRSLDIVAQCALMANAVDRLRGLDYYTGMTFSSPAGEVLVSRTGYTGERGYEIFVPAAAAADWWQALTEAGHAAGHALSPVGLGARDTLRFEAAFCLYGHELDEDTSPLEAGLGWVVKLKKPRFHGQAALKRQKASGPPRRLVGLELEGRNIARQGYSVLVDGEEVGKVTSGAFAPTLQKSLCMALLSTERVVEAKTFDVAVRGKRIPAIPSPLPFYKSRARA